MQLPPFETEHFYAQYEFDAPHLLSVSDCESVSIGELLERAGRSPQEFAELSLGYTESQGNPRLRQAIAETYQDISADDILVLATPIEGIYLAMRTLLEPNDEVIALTPAYDALKTLPDVLANVKPWVLRAKEGSWALDWEKLNELLSDKTKLIMVNFPHNPTGFLPTKTEFEKLVNVAQKRDIWLFSDEMYRGLEFGTRPQLPSACELYERSVTLSGLSKTYGLPGLRSGWLVVRDAEVKKRILNWKLYTSICPPAPSEYLAEVALSMGEQLAERNQQIVRDNLALAQGFFGRQPSLTWRAPLAGSTALIGLDVPSAQAYCHALAQNAGIVLLPSSFLGYDDKHVRFGFGRRSFAAALSAYEAHLKTKSAPL